MRPTTKSNRASKRSARKPARKINQPETPANSHIIDVTKQAVAAGLAYGIVAGVPPMSWLKEHGYIKDKK